MFKQPNETFKTYRNIQTGNHFNRLEIHSYRPKTHCFVRLKEFIQQFLEDF